ncbi:MAG: hypothetical protein QXZ14_11990 [Candidatus Jordarchaeales archaeon]
MSTLRVHRVKGKEVIKVYRLIPYGELLEVLREDGMAFLEDGARELKRGTVWRAARRLSEMLGKRVRVERAALRFEDGSYIEGWNFVREE